MQQLASKAGVFMPMRKIAAAVVCLGFASVWPSLSAAAASRPCEPRGSLTVAATGSVRVYLQPRRDRNGRVRSSTPTGGRTYGCLYRTGRSRLLAPASDGTLGAFDIAGGYVGFVSGGSAGHPQTVHLVPLARGRSFTNRIPDTTVTRLEITRRGSMAWIRDSDSGASVSKKDAGSSTVVVLDPGPTVAARSLAIGGPTATGAEATVYWTNAGQPRSAPLG